MSVDWVLPAWKGIVILLLGDEILWIIKVLVSHLYLLDVQKNN